MVTDDFVPDLGQAFASLRLVLLNNENIEEFLVQLAGVAASAVVSSAVSCGITTRLDGQHYTIATSDEWAAKLDETQYVNGQGPCLHAYETGEVVDVPDVAADRRWPGYRELAVSVGLQSSLSTPLSAAGQVVGALNLYSFGAPHAFNGEDRRRVQIFAAQAATALALTLRLVQRAETNDQLEDALGSRTVIDQALGILMGQQRCSAAEAFVLLQRHSQHTNRRLRCVAADLITRVTGRPPEPGPVFQRDNDVES